MPKEEQYAGNMELNFFPSATFEPELTNRPMENAGVIARNALRVLMMGWQHATSSLMSFRVFSAIFTQRDRELLRSMRKAFQQGFNHLYDVQLKNRSFTQQELNQIHLYLSNCLTLLPYADITPYESFNIPQYIQGEWVMVDYKVVPIELTPTEGFKKIFINDEDRVYAYGLEPIDHSFAEPHLIFMGTTYPAGQGFLTQINTDLESFETAGKKLYRSGHKRIKAWLDKQGEKKPHVCGTSLGGSLSLLLAMHHGERLSRVDALNPAGIYHPRRKSRFDQWDKCTSKPEVIIQRQANDPISLFGVWKEDWRLLHVIPPKEKQGPNPVIDHGLNYAGLCGTQFINLDVKQDNESRRAQNFWLYSVARSAFYYLVLVPYRYLVHPIVRYVLNHKIATAIAAVCLTLLAIFSPIIWVTPVVAAATALCALIVEICTHKRHPALLHDPLLPRNEEMDIYSNKMTKIFKVQELKDYYSAKRTVLKDKPLSQALVKSHVVFTSLSKKEIIDACDPAVLKGDVIIEASKAKIHDIKQTLSLLKHIGFHQPETLKQELISQHAEYSFGKTNSA